MGEIKILDTLVEVSGDAASDAGSTPAASTRATFLRGNAPIHHCRAPLRRLILKGSLVEPESTELR